MTSQHKSTTIPALLQEAVYYFERGDLVSANALCNQLLNTNPASQIIRFNTHHLLGVISLRKNNYTQALQQLTYAVQLQPNNTMALNALGCTQLEMGNLDLALNTLLRCSGLAPQWVDAKNNLALVYRRLHRYEEALLVLKESYSLNKVSYTTVRLLIEILLETSRSSDAINVLEDAVRAGLVSDELYNTVGLGLRKLNLETAAIEILQRGLGLNPHNAALKLNLASGLQQIGDFQNAANLYEDVIKLGLGDISTQNPEWLSRAHFNLALCELTLGLFATGWYHYTKRPNKIVHGNRLSRVIPGELHDCAVTVLGDQPLGDELFFLRFAKVLKERNCHVTYKGQLKLTSLLELAPDIDGLANTPQSDIVISTGDLPHLLNSVSVVPPLRFLLDQKHSCTNRFESGLPVIALTWRAGASLPASQEPNTVRDNPLFKEIPLSLLVSALSGIRANFVVLQRFLSPSELSLLNESLQGNIHDLSAYNEDLHAMARLLEQVDYYVGVSNTNMHILAGIGGAGLVLIPHPTEWRWGLQEKNSPWFPGFSLFRQSPSGDWEAALTCLRNELLTRIA